jgi:pyrroloquinoline quinone biosynthesis protein E
MPVVSPSLAGQSAENRKQVVPLRAPRDMYVILTSRCNLRCRHCYGDFGDAAHGGAELTGDQWIEVFRQAADLGVFFVNLAGGEPTLHPDFPRIIDGLVDLGLHFILTTNGITTPACLRALARARDHILGLKISIDGPTAASHGSLRHGLNGQPHPHAFEQSLRTAAYLRDHDVPYTVATCLHSDNIALIPEFEQLLAELRPTSWFLATISPVGRAREQYHQIIANDGHWSPEFWEGVRTRLNAQGIYVRYIDMATAQRADGRPSPFSCPAATEFCEIGADGTVSPCPLSRVVIPGHIMPFDNILQKNLRDIWHGEAFQTFRRWRGRGCEGCGIFGDCGRCVAQSLQWWQDPDMPPPFCIKKGEVLGLSDLPRLTGKLNERWAELGEARPCS